MAHYNHRSPLTRVFGDLFARVKVDQGSTSFFLGREFRAYKEFVNKVHDAPYVLRLTSPIDFILTKQSLTLATGAQNFKAYIAGGTPGGSWTALPTKFGKNRMTGRPGYPNPADPPYVSQVVIEEGGTFNIAGATEADVLKVRSGTNQGNQSSTNVGAGDNDYRGLPAGTYYLVVNATAGTPANTDVVNGVYSIEWEERPQGNVG